jgi:hypothetical protein
VLTLYEGNQPDGIVPCGAGTNGQRMIYGSGVGSPEFEFPPGVGLHLVPGDKVLVNLHLYNATDGDISGTSGTLVKTVPASEIQHDAEIVLAGPTFSLNVPVGMSTQTGNCQISSIASEPIQVFAVAMHMHKTGIHLKSEVIRGGQTIATRGFGDSSDDEMCFTDIFYYPAQGAQFICTGL